MRHTNSDSLRHQRAKKNGQESRHRELRASLAHPAAQGCRQWYLEFHLCIQGLLPFLHETQAEGLEVDLMLCLLDDLSQQSPRSSQVIVLGGQQVLEHHCQVLGPHREKTFSAQ